MKYGFVYIWYDRKHKRYYVGCHWGTEEDGYICSSMWMRNSYTRRPHDFKRRILKRTDIREELFKIEDYFLSMIKLNEFGKRYYNLRKHSAHWTEKEEKRLTIGNKISRAKKGKKTGFSWNKGKKINNKPKVWSEEGKKRLSEAAKGRTPWNKGKKCEYISIAKKGVNRSEETKLKISNSLKARGRSNGC